MPNPGRCWRPCRSIPGRAQFLHAASHGRSNAARPFASDKQEHRPGRTRCNRNADQARGIRHRGGFLCRHLLSLPCAAGELPEGLRGRSSHVTHKLNVKSAPIRLRHLPPPRRGRDSLLTHPVSPPAFAPLRSGGAARRAEGVLFACNPQAQSQKRPIRFHHLPPPRGGRNSLLTHPVSPPSKCIDPEGPAATVMQINHAASGITAASCGALCGR